MTNLEYIEIDKPTDSIYQNNVIPLSVGTFTKAFTTGSGTLESKAGCVIYTEEIRGSVKYMVFKVYFNNSPADGSVVYKTGDYYAFLPEDIDYNSYQFFGDEFTGNMQVYVYSDLYKQVSHETVYLGLNQLLVKEYTFNMEYYQCRLSSNYNAQFDIQEIGRLQDKDETITENTVTVITPDVGYSGLGEVTVRTNVSDSVNIESTKTVNITQNGITTINPDTDYDAIAAVTVNTAVPVPTIEQSKSVTFRSNGTWTISPDSGYDGIGEVEITNEVPVPVLENSKVVPITTNTTTTITPDNGYDALSSVIVTTNIPVKNNQSSKSVSITSNGTYTISPTSPYDGMDEVIANVSVPSPVNVQYGKTITLTENGQTTVRPSTGYDTMATVSVYVDVPPEKPYIKTVSLTSGLINNSYIDISDPQNWSNGSNGGNITIPAQSTLFAFNQENDGLYFECIGTGSDAATYTFEGNRKYIVLNYLHSGQIYLLDTNNTVLFVDWAIISTSSNYVNKFKLYNVAFDIPNLTDSN